MDTADLIRKLCAINAMTGFENKACEAIQGFFQPVCDKTWVDSFFNVIGYKKGLGETPKKIMITAHYDQIGMIVSGYEKNGFLRVSNLGGIDTKALMASEVMVHGKEDLYGIIGAKPPHLLTEQETKKNVKIIELFLDTGLSDEELKQKTSPGDPISIVSEVVSMENGCIAGKSLDNRAGVAALVLILEQLQALKHDNDIYVVATVQEETELLGAISSAWNLNPDLALVIDVCHGDMPEADKNLTYPLGKGVPVGIGPAFHRQETKALLEVAKQERIPTQLCIEPGDPGTEAWAIQVSHTGVPTLEACIPLRYMHTGIELLLVKDIELTVALVAKYSATQAGAAIGCVDCC
ncbi:MAG: M20/M25/M40 family metallo-hydrolase [Thermoclostridium sp.]|nr:M20/M25/M40 family metallo-hydrolase [Thermoclostridium sp.]